MAWLGACWHQKSVWRQIQCDFWNAKGCKKWAWCCSLSNRYLAHVGYSSDTSSLVSWLPVWKRSSFHRRYEWSGVRGCCGVSGEHLQLPNLSGQAWASIGKSSRCMGHSARTVSLKPSRRQEKMIKRNGCANRNTRCPVFVDFHSIGGKRCQTVSLPQKGSFIYFFLPPELLFSDSLQKNSMSGQPWHTNLLTVPSSRSTVTATWPTPSPPNPHPVNMLNKCLAILA